MSDEDGGKARKQISERREPSVDSSLFPRPDREPVHRLDEANRLIRDGRDMTSPRFI